MACVSLPVLLSKKRMWRSSCAVIVRGNVGCETTFVISAISSCKWISKNSINQKLGFFGNNYYSAAICFFNLPPYRFIRIEFDDGFARLDVVYNARATIISSHKVRRIIVNPVDGRGNKSTSAAGITGKSLEERRGMRWRAPQLDGAVCSTRKQLATGAVVREVPNAVGVTCNLARNNLHLDKLLLCGRRWQSLMIIATDS